MIFRKYSAGAFSRVADWRGRPHVPPLHLRQAEFAPLYHVDEMTHVGVDLLDIHQKWSASPVNRLATKSGRLRIVPTARLRQSLPMLCLELLDHFPLRRFPLTGSSTSLNCTMWDSATVRQRLTSG